MWQCQTHVPAFSAFTNTVTRSPGAIFLASRRRLRDDGVTVRRFLGQHSFVVAALLLVAIAVAITWWRTRRRWVRAAIPLGLAAAALVAFLIVRIGPGNIDSVADFDRALAGGRPVMLELYSEY